MPTTINGVDVKSVLRRTFSSFILTRFAGEVSRGAMG